MKTLSGPSTLKTLIAASLLALTALGAHAAEEKPKKEPSAKQLAQQERMKTCQTDATASQKKGDERKAFMSACLSGKAASEPALTAQQSKMTTCNAEAKAAGKTGGEDRKAFMKACLSGK